LHRLVLIFALLSALASAGCHRSLSPEEKATRAELRQALREGSYAQAEKLARRVLQTSSHENGAWERLVHAQLGLRDFAGAKQTFAQWRRAVRKPSPKLDEFSGDVAAEEGDPVLALQLWKKALSANPRQVHLLRKIASLQQAQHRWADEDAALTAALAIEENATDRMARALCRRRLHRWSEALEDYRRACQLAPEDPDVHRGAKLFERLSKFLAHIRDLDARLAVTPADDQLLADRALLSLRSEDAELALEDTVAAANSAPWAMRPRIFQAIALLQLGRGEEASRLGITPGLRLEGLSSEFLETLSRLDSEISVERSNAELYVARAWQLNDVGQPTLALEDAETALRFDQKSAGAYAERGYASAKLGRGDEAFDRVKRATELDPNFSTGWQYRGELEMTRSDFVAAIESFSRALAINQTTVALQKREQCYRQIGLFTKAEEDHRTLETLNSRAPAL
jgi:tetratricopeptide (TPR) repeat protein